MLCCVCRQAIPVNRVRLSNGSYAHGNCVKVDTYKKFDNSAKVKSDSADEVKVSENTGHNED